MPSKNFYGTNNDNIYINCRLIAAYLSTVGPNYSNDYPDYKKELTSNNNFYGFLHCIDGNGSIDTVHGTLHIGKNDFVFFRYHDIKKMYCGEEKWTYFCVWFFTPSIELNFNTIYNFTISKTEHDDIVNMIALLQNKTYIDTCIANTTCMLLVYQFIKQIGESTFIRSYSLYMRKVSAYINKNLNGDLSVSQLASLCGFCKNQFLNIFKQYFGITPKQYILRAKIEKACFLLSCTRESIVNISNELNFNSPSHFTSCFRAKLGVSPAEYRRQHLLFPENGFLTEEAENEYN